MYQQIEFPAKLLNRSISYEIQKATSIKVDTYPSNHFVHQSISGIQSRCEGINVEHYAPQPPLKLCDSSSTRILGSSVALLTSSQWRPT